MNFIKIKPHGPEDNTTYWISTIYKIVQYTPGVYTAFYMHYLDNNWGRYVPGATHKLRHKHARASTKYWPRLIDAKKACQIHSLDHEPDRDTIKRAKEVRDQFIEMDVAHVA